MRLSSLACQQLYLTIYLSLTFIHAHTNQINHLRRYDNLKKYGSRVQSGIDTIIDTINSAIKSNTYATIADASDPIYQIRPLGLLANGFLASENTGATNELFLARWYINEIYLRIGDVKGAATEGDASEAYGAAKKAINSYLSMMNRQISSKVGEKFKYV